MKKYILILITLFFGCSDDIPNNLISKKKMENIIFDIMILNASNGFDLKIDNNLLSDELIYKKHNIDKSIVGDELIYKKYNIDSIQFYESELYYSRYPKIQYEIYSNVKRRIIKSIDSLKNSSQ